MACTYKFNKNGVEIELNDVEFDSYLYDLLKSKNLTYNDLRAYLMKYPERIFSLDRKTQALAQVDKMQNSI